MYLKRYCHSYVYTYVLLEPYKLTITFLLQYFVVFFVCLLSLYIMMYIVLIFSSAIIINSSYLMSKLQQEIKLLCELEKLEKLPVSSQERQMSH